MKKTNSLSSVDLYAIYYLLDNGKDAKFISKELDIGIKSVKDAISSRPTQQNNNIKTTSSKISSKDMMIRQTAGKGTKSVSIMTKEASEINDTFRQNLDKHVSSRSSKNAIYRPNN